MDALLLNFEEQLGSQFQGLIRQLVKQQVQEQLQQLQKTEQQAVTVSPEPKKPNAVQLKKMIKEMTPGLIRKEQPLDIQTRMLMKLYECREDGIAPKDLFSYAGTGKIAGYRYITFFKDREYSAFIGPRKNGKYILTEKGRELLETL